MSKQSKHVATIAGASTPTMHLMKRECKWVANVVQKYIEQMPFKKYAGRQKILQNNKNPNNVDAFALGKVFAWGRGRVFDSRYNALHPELYMLLQRMMQLQDPKFKYTSIQINRGVNTAWHRDKRNLGLSYCLALGDYEGGGIEVRNVDGSTKQFDNKNKWMLYDGNRIAHRSVPPTRGRRIAIIFYTLGLTETHKHLC